MYKAKKKKKKSDQIEEVDELMEKKRMEDNSYLVQGADGIYHRQPPKKPMGPY